jgi:hypothetical protein
MAGVIHESDEGSVAAVVAGAVAGAAVGLGVALDAGVVAVLTFAISCTGLPVSIPAADAEGFGATAALDGGTTGNTVGLTVPLVGAGLVVAVPVEVPCCKTGRNCNCALFLTLSIVAWSGVPGRATRMLRLP